MFLGQHEHALDVKGRVILPSDFRDAFEGGAVLTKLLDGCLALWTKEEFGRVAQELVEKAKRGPRERNVARALGASAKELTPDKHGRVVIPPTLRDFARLDRDVVILGAINRVEIWDAATWADINSRSEDDLREAEDALNDIFM